MSAFPLFFRPARPLAQAAALALAVLGSAPGALHAGKADPDPAAAPPAPSAAPEAPGAPRHLEVPIPVGHDAKGVRLPYFNIQSGNLDMYFNIGTAYRVDDAHLRCSKMEIQTFAPGAKPDMSIQMETSILNLNTHVVSTPDQATVRRADFELSGAKLTFNTQKRRGRFTGPVRMLIYNMAAGPNPAAQAQDGGAHE